jgi:hypothetical protein
MMCDIFASWFEHEFVLSVKYHLHSKKLEERALLYAWITILPIHMLCPEIENGKMKVMFLRKNATALIHPMDQGII